jgi:hypothetical protein
MSSLPISWNRFGRKEAKIHERLCCWIFDHTEEDMLFKKELQ